MRPRPTHAAIALIIALYAWLPGCGNDEPAASGTKAAAVAPAARLDGATASAPADDASAEEAAAGRGLEAAASPDPNRGGPAVKLNVLLISLDTLRSDHLGCYGYDKPVSPRIDALAHESVRFERAYSHAPWTTPAHAAMLTSLYPSVLGLKRYPETGRIADAVETMAEFFKAQGYLTHAVTEGGMVHAQFGFAQGFDYYFQSARHVDQGLQKTEEWLDKYGDKPFFFFFHTYDIHRYTPPEEYKQRFTDPGYHGKLAGMEEIARQIQDFDNEKFVASLDADDLTYLEGLYDASIAWVDYHVGLLLDYLKGRGLLERTIVVLTSDHGEEFLERTRTGHGYTNFEEQIHVPLIFLHPDVTPGVRKTLFRHVDLLPTVADSAGLPSREAWLGDSLWKCIRDGEDDGAAKDRRYNFCEAGHSYLRSVESLRWKLIENQKPKQVMLFNLEQDPGERHDLSEERPEVRNMMEGLLHHIEDANAALSPTFSGEEVNPSDLPADLIEDLRKLGYL